MCAHRRRPARSPSEPSVAWNPRSHSCQWAATLAPALLPCHATPMLHRSPFSPPPEEFPIQQAREGGEDALFTFSSRLPTSAKRKRKSGSTGEATLALTGEIQQRALGADPQAMRSSSKASRPRDLGTAAVWLLPY